MNQGSLPFIGVRSFRETVKRVLGRLLGGRRRAADPALRSRAAVAIREFAEAHAPLFERAERLVEKADRLERAGTPSESARNRAERARREIEANFAALRASFSGQELQSRYPELEIPDASL
jgi:hypothetical protein